MPGFKVFRSFFNFTVLAIALFATVFLNSCSFKKSIQGVLSQLNTELPQQKTSKAIVGSCKNQFLNCSFNTEQPNLFTFTQESKKGEKTPPLPLREKLSDILPLRYSIRENIAKIYQNSFSTLPLFIIHDTLLL